MTKSIFADILVIGGGAAGCFAAIKAKQAGAKKVLLIDKGHVGKSGCSKFAAGSFKCFIPREDNWDLWFSKAVDEGWFINDQDWTRTHLEEVFDRARELETWGLEFIKDENGCYERLEGQGSSDERPIKTLMFRGPELMDVLRKAARLNEVTIMDKTMATHLFLDQAHKRAIGAYAFDQRSGHQFAVQAGAVILAAGAQAYKSHYAYQKMVTGDAHVMALKAGAELTNYEFCCHHLSCADFDTTGMNVLQGAGARFVNGRGESYMQKYDFEYGDHAAMNRLSGAMACEVFRGNGPIYYDFSDFTEESLVYFNKTLPIMYRAFERAGYIKDGKIRERVEWVSVNNGNVGYGGGVRINTNCETNIQGLYAAGDSTCGPASGVEGFCAYAIPFAVTSGARSGLFAADYVAKTERAELIREQVCAAEQDLCSIVDRKHGMDPDYVVLKVQELLFPMEVYLLRHEKRLNKALRGIRDLKDNVVPKLKAVDPHGLRMAIEASNMVRCSELFLVAALERKESRGSHLRIDYPEIDNNDWLKWVILKGKEGQILTRLEPIPFDKYPYKPERKKIKHPVAKAMEDLGTPLN